ncbi:MAG: DUF2997 domain-containing protein [Candidatus Omnitrophica bacterium]|nr:DUF2997 domain-containing protein [Candidatus Omnitrophota bacterium]
MTSKQEIEILISEEGDIKFHIKGIKGAKCLELVKVLEKKFGKVKDLTLTSEYYEKEDLKTKPKQKLKH